ncbi:hypothetical protein [Pararobbsia alpina]|uniref:hypothetical protein n=1 Tax=Pararobbsia alpina TaxID=621374 RepID=UPI0039A61AA2
MSKSDVPKSAPRPSSTADRFKACRVFMPSEQRSFENYSIGFECFVSGAVSRLECICSGLRTREHSECGGYSIGVAPCVNGIGQGDDSERTGKSPGAGHEKAISPGAYISRLGMPDISVE